MNIREWERKQGGNPDWDTVRKPVAMSKSDWDLGKGGPRKIQANPSTNDPKPWIRTEPMPRPWRKDKKSLPLGSIAREYNKKNPKAKESRARDLASRKAAVAPETTRPGETMKSGGYVKKYAKGGGVRKVRT